jgi:hypothetical protein
LKNSANQWERLFKLFADSTVNPSLGVPKALEIYANLIILQLMKWRHRTLFQISQLGYRWIRGMTFFF